MKQIGKLKFILWTVVLLLGATSFAQTMVEQNEVVLNIESVENCKIYGTLKVPKTNEKVPIALIIAGSGPTDRNGNNPMMTCNAYQMLSDSLNRYGIASLSYDKRLIAKSKCEQKEDDLRFEDYVEDVRSWIEFLSENELFSEIIVIGHSEGSLIGMIASVNNLKVSKFISIAGIGSSGDEILKEQLSKQLESQPITIKDQIFSYIDELKQGRLLENVPLSLYSLFRPSVQPYMISWFKYNPQEEIAKLKIPILILQGDFDIQVSENEANLLHQANLNAKKVIINHMNHVLKNSLSKDMNEQMADSYNNPNTPINKELVENIVEFTHGHNQQ
jgi:pimeloyl-ACP methyl ester carboxylesterase